MREATAEVAGRDLGGRDTGNNLEPFTLLLRSVLLHKQQLISRLLQVPVEPVMRRVCRSQSRSQSSILSVSFRDPGVSNPGDGGTLSGLPGEKNHPGRMRRTRSSSSLWRTAVKFPSKIKAH